MKQPFVLVATALLAAGPMMAQVEITSFNVNGQLTWTNTLSSNGTYRVEWAGSPVGPFQAMDVLTNLTLLSATSNSVTITVPTVYRVVWVDPPPPQPNGTWDYQAYYDDEGVPLVTGRLFMVSASNTISGTRDLWTTGKSGADPGTQIGKGQLEGSFAGNELFVDLNPRSDDDGVELHGRMIGGYADGFWGLRSIAGGLWPGGRFVAVRLPGPVTTARSKLVQLPVKNLISTTQR